MVALLLNFARPKHVNLFYYPFWYIDSFVLPILLPTYPFQAEMLKAAPAHHWPVCITRGRLTFACPIIEKAVVALVIVQLEEA